MTDDKKLTNVADPSDNKDSINNNYFDEVFTSFKGAFLKKNEDIDMNGKSVKNLWSHDNNDAVPKKYLFQYGLLFDSKSNSFNAKDKKIVNALDPEDLQEFATRNYADKEISKLKLSITQANEMIKLYSNSNYHKINEV